MINNSAVNYSSPLGGDQDVEFYDGNNLLFNFSHNFDVNPIDLSKISINKSDNFIIINTSGQAFTKTVYISDKFDTYCVKDAEITSIAEISSDCTGIDEFKFDSCKGGSQTIGSIYCYDDGTNLIFDGLGHSAILGSNTLSPNSPSTTNTKNNYMDSGGQCITNWSCSNWSICSNGYQNRVCSESIKGCYADPKNKPIENQSCLSNNQNNVIQSNKQIKGSNNYLLWLIVLLVIVFAIFLTSRKIRKIRKGY